MLGAGVSLRMLVREIASPRACVTSLFLEEKLPSFSVPPPRLQGAKVQHFIPERKKTVVQRLSQISQAATLGGRGTEDSIFLEMRHC